jgi:hypothetical protein
MENILLVYGTVVVLALSFFAFHALRSNETSSRRLAKIRVPVDERGGRKRVEDRHEDDYDSRLPLSWLAFATSVILGLVLLQAL